MIDLLHTRKLTRSEEIIREWNRTPRLVKRVRNAVALAAVATTIVVYSITATTPANDLTSTGETFPAAKLTEIQQLRPQTTSGLLPLYRSALPAMSTETVAVIASPIS